MMSSAFLWFFWLSVRLLAILRAVLRFLSNAMYRTIVASVTIVIISEGKTQVISFLFLATLADRLNGLGELRR